MEKIIGTYNYGLCLFSVDNMTQFLKERKIRSKKVLKLLQDKRDLFLDTIREGILLPIPSINSGKYALSVDGFDEPFGEDWTEVLSYGGFNLDVKNGFWVSDIGSLLEFDRTEFQGEGREVTSPYGTVHYYSDRLRWDKDLGGKLTYSDYRYDVPEGKYLVSVAGMVRKNITDKSAVNYGFRFTLTKADSFTSANNPREEQYCFNAEWIHTTKPATVHWLPKNAAGIKTPLKEAELRNSVVIPLENEQKAYLTISFELANQTAENVSRCRVKLRYFRKSDRVEGFELESGREYPIFEETYKRGKTVLKELGRLLID